MPSFRYIATDADGNRVSGECEAASVDDAVAQLEMSGFHLFNLEPVVVQFAPGHSESGSDDPQRRKLFSTSDLDQVTERIGELAQAGLPLITGLRALGEEVTDSRLKRTLNDFSRRLESGESLDQVLRAHRRNVPEHLNGLILAGLQTNQLGLMIERYVSFVQNSSEVRRKVWLSLAYPLVLIFATLGFAFAFSYFVVPQFRPLYYGFDMELPVLTKLTLDAADAIVEIGFYLAIATTVFVVGGWIGLGLLAGPAMRSRLVGIVPIVGPLFRYAALSRYCQLLGLLVEHRIILPDALRLAGSGSGDANLREGSMLLSEDVSHGIPLEDASRSRPHFPSSLINVFRWERRDAAFSDALYSSAEIYAAMAKTQTGMVAVVCEPLLLIGVGAFMLFSIVALFLPLINLLNDLS